MDPEKSKHYSGFEIGSLIFGGLSILLCAWVYASLFCGAFGVLFYFLGKKRNVPPSTLLQAGLLCSLLGICIALVLTVYTVIIIGRQSNGLHGGGEEIQRMLRKFLDNIMPAIF